jgi:hypothetical protein
VQGADHLAVAGGGLLGGQTAGIGEDEEDGTVLAQRPAQVVHRPGRQDGHVGDRLGAGRIVVEDDETGAAGYPGGHFRGAHVVDWRQPFQHRCLGDGPCLGMKG